MRSLKENAVSRVLDLAKLPLKKEGEMETWPDPEKIRWFIMFRQGAKDHLPLK